MSSTTAPAELEIPRDLMPALVDSATFGVLSCMQDVSFPCSIERRADADAVIASIIAAVDARAAVLRALDDNVPVPVKVLQGIPIRSTIEMLRDTAMDDLRFGTSFGEIADKTRVMRDLCTWSADNGLVPEALTA